MSYNDVVLFLQGAVLSLWAMWEVRIIVIHTLVNFVVAVAVAISSGEFASEKLIDVFARKLLPLVMIYAVFKFAGMALAGAPPEAGFSPFVQGVAKVLPLAVLAAIELLLIKDLADNLVKVPGLGGIVDLIPTSLVNAFLVKKETE